MKRLLVGTMLILTLAAAASASAQEVEFNYNGRIKTGGHPFDGTGMFKFSLVSRTADITFWANDGEALDGSEPTTHVLVSVENGLFSVDIGDTEIEGMAPLDASLFNGDEKVYLRTWFSDGVHGFELLQPDRKVTNPALLGTQSQREITIYVSDSAGNDRNAGATSTRPKKTIQAAWDALPPLLRKNATIYVDGGTYRENVAITGKTPLENATVTITRNPSSSTDVIVCGSDEPASTTILRQGFSITNQKNICVSNISFVYCGHAILVEKGSSLDVSDCSMTDCGVTGLFVTEMSTAYATRLSIAHGRSPWQWGVRADNNSAVWLDSCTISDFSMNGACAIYLSRLYVKDTSVSQSAKGFVASTNSYLEFQLGSGNNHATNCAVGTEGESLSYVAYANDWVTYTSCVQNTDSLRGSVFYH